MVQNIIYISFDGARRAKVASLLSSGVLPGLKEMLTDGGFISNVTITPLLIDNGGVLTPIDNPSEVLPEDTVYYEHAVTDSGHAQMLTGKYSPDVSMCNPSGVELYDYICSNNYNIVPPGETIMEIIRSNSSMAVGVCSGRRADNRDFSGIQGYGRFFGFGIEDIWAVNNLLDAIAGHGFFSTTFMNSLPSLDYFFDSSKVTEYTENDSWWNFYKTDGTFIVGRELKATHVALKSNEFINNSINSSKNFFLFVHFCEPDMFGHIYGEGSTEYAKAIVECDKGVKIITDNLKAAGLYNNTLVVVTTDHGAEPNSGPAGFQYINGKKVFVEAGPLHGQLDQDNHLVWMINNKINIPSINQINIAPFILASLNLIGSLDITSTPPGASVYINNEYRGVTPVSINNATAGIKNIQLNLDGYPKYTQSAEVRVGQTTAVAAELNPVPVPPKSTDFSMILLASIGLMMVLSKNKRNL